MCSSLQLLNFCSPKNLYYLSSSASTSIGFGVKKNENEKYSSSSSRNCHRNGGRDSEFEVDPDKAREALRKLDQQFQSISDKPITLPKIRATEVNYTREQAEFDRGTQQSAAGLPEGSFQTLLVVALLIFTVFYNVLFITVIKPSIDGPGSGPTTASQETPKTNILQQLPLEPNDSLQ